MKCLCGCGEELTGRSNQRFVNARHRARANWAARDEDKREAHRLKHAEQQRNWRAKVKASGGNHSNIVTADTKCNSCFFIAQCREQVARVNRIAVRDDNDMATRTRKLPCFVE